MSFYDSSDALYGTGRHGSARYGKVSPNVALSGVSATGAIETVSVGGFEIDISENLLSVSATGAIGSVGVGNSATLTGVSATGSINTVKENVAEELGSVSATGAIGTIEPQVDEDLLSVTATFTIGTVKPNLSKTLGTVVGTSGARAVTTSATATPPITGLELTGSINAPEPVVDEGLQSVAATVSIGSINVGVTEKLASASASAVVNLPTANVASIQFDYEAVKHRYNKRRTVLLPRVA
jgi:hypothetical protein